jgi:arylamine N-acetyltransferase
MEGEVSVASFLRRIGFLNVGDEKEALRQLFPINLDSLFVLHRHFSTHVPFENLDISIKPREIVLDLKRILHKVVLERRGGFCFELNGSFYWLLCQLGFKVHMLSARICSFHSGIFGPVNTHLTLAVEFPKCSNWYICDVGNGAAAMGPIELHDGAVQDRLQYGRAFVSRRLGCGAVRANGTIVEASDPMTTWRLMERVPATDSSRVPGTVFNEQLGSVEPAPLSTWFDSMTSEEPAPRSPSSWGECCLFELEVEPVEYSLFKFMCNFHQTDPRSSFMRGAVASMATPSGGRVTFSSGIWSGAAEVHAQAFLDAGGWRLPSCEVPQDSMPGSPRWQLALRAVAHAPRECVDIVGVAAAAEALKHHFQLEMPFLAD